MNVTWKFSSSRLLVLITVFIAASFSVVSNAYANTTTPTGNHQSQPQLCYHVCGDGGSISYSDSYSWGTATGTAKTDTQNLNGSDTSDGTSISVQATGINQEYTDTLAHSIIQTTFINNNGTQEIKFYVYTKSAYAPNGDSGTFIVDATHDVILQGSPADWSRLANEIEEADPGQVAVARNIFGDIGGWLSANSNQIITCGEFSGFAVAGTAMFLSGPESWGELAAGALEYGPDVVDDATECF